MIAKVELWSSVLRNSKRRCLSFICGAAIVLLASTQPLLIGRIYRDVEAVELLKGLQSSSLYFGSAVAGSSATVLALMLTLLSMTNKLDVEFDRSIYGGIKLIGLISTVTFIGSVILLLGLSLPIGEFDNIPNHWFTILYYTFSIAYILLFGLVIVGILVLFDTINLLLHKLSP